MTVPRPAGSRACTAGPSLANYLERAVPMRSAWSLRVVVVALLVLVFHLDVSPDLRIAGVLLRNCRSAWRSRPVLPEASNAARTSDSFFGFAIDLFFFHTDWPSGARLR